MTNSPCVREVHDTDDAERDREAERGEGVEAGSQDAEQQGLR